MGQKKIGALCYLPGQKKIYTFNASNARNLASIDDVWMKEEGLVFYPFDRQKAAYFFASKKNETKLGVSAFAANTVIEKQEYISSVLLAQAAIDDHALEKVVLARNHFIEKGSYSPEQSFANAIKEYPESYCYYVNVEDEIWVGASPELLIHFENETLTTTALAGTLPLDQLFSQKEEHEQEMVELFILEKFQKLGIENVTKSQKKEQVFGDIKHLKTDFEAKVNINQALEFLKNLQPTSAVCGLPRDASFKFLQEYETLDRSFYSGVTGVLEKDSATFFVNLRCMRFYENTIELFAGAGITSESIPENEWEETERKLSAIRKILK